jgi:hypothetical protein
VAAFFPPPFNHFSLFATQSVEASSPFDKGMLLPFWQGQLHLKKHTSFTELPFSKATCSSLQ